MKTPLRASLLSALALITVTSLACDDTAMDKDLKRQADRATIRLSRVETERDALQAELSKTKADVVKAHADTDAASRELESLRLRVTRLESDLLQARTKIRELEDAALAARQGMPTTRKPQP